MQKLTVIENELVPVYETSTGEKVVYGTELYSSLGSKQDYSNWIKNRLNDCDAAEDEDFTIILSKSTGGRPKKEYIIRLDIAKEMAMLERNRKGKQVRRYFILVEKKYNEGKRHMLIPFKEQVECVGVVADMLKVNDASKILMLEGLYKSYSLPTEFLPKYEHNGSRELRSATELLKKYALGISAAKFNSYMIDAGFLEIKTRKSTKDKNKERQFKALTAKGLKYGENVVSPQNQREVQPLYYIDTFEELFRMAVYGEVA